MRYLVTFFAVVSLLILGSALVPPDPAATGTLAAAAAQQPARPEVSLTPSPVPTCGWIQFPSADPSSYAQVRGMSAHATNDVWAVGSAITHWNGNEWSLLSNFGSGLALAAVSAVSANDVWAVGHTAAHTYRTLIAHYDGTLGWSTITSPNSPGFDNVLTGVVARTATDIWAVGYSLNNDGYQQTLILHGDSTAWSIRVYAQ